VHALKFPSNDQHPGIFIAFLSFYLLKYISPSRLCLHAKRLADSVQWLWQRRVLCRCTCGFHDWYRVGIDGGNKPCLDVYLLPSNSAATWAMRDTGKRTDRFVGIFVTNTKSLHYIMSFSRRSHVRLAQLVLPKCTSDGATQ
jgi:hypothetical protein